MVLTALYFYMAQLSVHGEVLEIHWARGGDGESATDHTILRDCPDGGQRPARTSMKVYTEYCVLSTPNGVFG